MPLLHASANTVRNLDSSSYSDVAVVGGVGVRTPAYQKMTELMNGMTPDMKRLEAIVSENMAKHMPGFDKTEDQLFVQHHATAHASLMAELKQRVKERNATAFDSRTGNNVYPKRKQLLEATPQSKIDKYVDMQSIVNEVQDRSRNIMSTGQVLALNKMVAEWLTLVEVLIACAAEAEKEMTGLVAEINAERQAMWKLVGDVISTILTFTVPPPVGMILGGVVKAVLTSDSWTTALTSSASSAMGATHKGSEEVWEKDDTTSQWGPSTKTVYKAAAVQKAPGGQDTLGDYKDIPSSVIGGVQSCMGKPAREAMEEINNKTLMHLTDMPAPPKETGDKAIKVIRDEVQKAVKFIMISVGELLGQYMSTQTGPAKLVYASYTYQADGILTGLGTRSNEIQKTQFVQQQVREGCILYLNTAAHELLLEIAQKAKPKFNVLNIDKGQVKKQFEVMFWAGYLDKAARNAVKGVDVSSADVVNNSTAESHYAKKYGTIKKLVWRGRVETKLKELGITENYQPFKAHRLSWGSRSQNYSHAIQDWRPPQAGAPWKPVPYQDGGSDNSKGRLAAWAVKFNQRPPTELFKAIMG